MTQSEINEIRANRDAHIQRHQKLHEAIDELFSDFIRHNPNEETYTGMPVIKLIRWAAKQADSPSESDICDVNIGYEPLPKIKI